MDFYEELAEDALALLTEFGGDAIVNQRAISSANQITGIVNTGTPVLVPAKGLLLDYVYRTFGDVVAPDSLIYTSSKRILLSAVPNLKRTDTVTIGGDEYQIHVIKSIAPSGIVVLYDLWVMR